jgi:electron-transferring-flavoprotein dehydrogenase
MSRGHGPHPPNHAPSEFPPPVDPVREFIKRGLDSEDERIDVGVAIVGGGTAGLSCANRLLQLLAEDEALMERLGEVPVAVIEKAKTCGGHNLSGAVMRPGPLQELFPDMSREDWRKERFAFGEVTKESVYMLPSAKTKVSVPIPFVPNFKNHGNEVVSVAALARYQAQQAEEAGAYILTETSATQLIVEDGKVVGVRSGDKGRGKDGEPLGNFEPGTDINARATVLAEGCWGHLTGAAIKEFDLGDGREPQVWELGVKEVWKVSKPLDRVIHTFSQPWPMKVSPKYGQLGGTWIYPMKDEKTGDDLVSIGFVVDLNYRDATTSAHDLLQTFKTHRLVKGILDGGERVAWGAKALPGGGYWSMPKLSMPGAVLVGDSGGMVDTAALKGVHHCIKSGKLAAEAIFRHLQTGASLESYEQAVEDSSIGKELYQVRNARQAFQRGFIKGSLLAGPAIMSKGKVPPGRQKWHRDDAEPLFVGDTRDAYPKPDGKYTFDKLASVYISGNATRDDAPNHIRVHRNVPREIAEGWRYMCPAGVYEIPDDAPPTGPVDVTVNYTNCVQCGAITAKGGRLTPPEGGDGPLYTIT